jgi:hypothetical protein
MSPVVREQAAPEILSLDISRKLWFPLAFEIEPPTVQRVLLKSHEQPVRIQGSQSHLVGAELLAADALHSLADEAAAVAAMEMIHLPGSTVEKVSSIVFPAYEAAEPESISETPVLAGLAFDAFADHTELTTDFNDDGYIPASQDLVRYDCLVLVDNHGKLLDVNTALGAYPNTELSFMTTGLFISLNPVPNPDSPELISTLTYQASENVSDVSTCLVHAKFYAEKVWILAFYANSTDNMPVNDSYSFRDLIVRGNYIRSFTTTPATYPVLPCTRNDSGFKNVSDSWLYISANSSYLTTNGYVYGNTLDSNRIKIGASDPILARSTVRGDTTYYGSRSGWGFNNDNIDSVFSLQEVQGTAGIGGGNGVCGGQVNPYFAKYSDDL